MSKAENAVMQAILDRRSVRKYTDEPVSKEDILTILEAGRWSPSGLNNQPWRFLVIMDGDGRKEKLAECTKYSALVENCKALVGVFLDRDAMYSELKDHQTAGACLQNMMLAAHSIGLGTVWLGEIVNQSEKVLEALSLDPTSLEVMAFLAIGHPAHPGASSRKSLEELMIEEF